MKISPPHIGWLIVLGWSLALLLACGSALYGLRTRSVVREARFVLDSLRTIRCLPIPKDTVLVVPYASPNETKAHRHD